MKKLSTILTLAFILCFVFNLAITAEPFNGEKPEEFKQAPELKKLVEKGELPPVQERLPKGEDVYVVKPNEEIGSYGGTLKTATIQMEGFGDDNFFGSFTNPLMPTADGSGLYPHVIKRLESSNDMSTFIMHLREGLKWSDGHLLTADDILFWYEDVLLNEQLTPAVAVTWKSGEEVVDVEKIDDYSVKFSFKRPKPYFKNRLVHAGAWNLFFPKHYLKDFHPNYVSETELNKEIESEDYDNWWELFNNKNRTIYGQPITMERPTLGPYVLSKKTSSRRIYKRNPYFWKVDPEGNQLPYVGRIETTLCSDIEVVNGKIISGEIDYAVQQSSVTNYPMYKNYEDEAGYKTVLWESGRGAQTIYMVNMTHQDPKLRDIFQDVKFRKALSLAMDREEINNSLYFGKAIPRQYTVLDSSQYYEEKFAKAYTEHQPEKAKQLLAEIGLKDSDGDGWREFPDGKEFNFTIEYFGNQPWRTPSSQLVSQQWQEVGLNVKTKEITGELVSQRAPANLLDATLWNGDKATDILFPTTPQFIMPYSPGWERTIWPQWARWFQTDGNSGEEPPANIKELHQWWRNMLVEPDREKRIELGKKILNEQAENLWCIGTVGKVPYPIIINKNLGNFPKEGIGVWDTVWTMSRDPEQFFFKNEQ